MRNPLQSRSSEDPPMPLGTAVALQILKEPADSVGPLGRVEARFSTLQALFEPELSYIEAELRKAATDGVRPATLAADHLVGAGRQRLRPLTLPPAAARFRPHPRATRGPALVPGLVPSAPHLPGHPPGPVP